MSRCEKCKFGVWSNWHQLHVCELADYENPMHLDRCPKDTIKDALLIIANYCQIEINTERADDE